MAQRSHVPKFGNWEEENVHYTTYFDRASQGRSPSRVINPNDSQEKPDVLSQNGLKIGASSLAKKGEAEESVGNLVGRSTHDHQRSREERELRQLAESPARSNMGRKASSFESARQHHGTHGMASGEAHRRARNSMGSENSLERSPFHNQAKFPGLVSPSREGKRYHESSHGTPGRSITKAGIRASDSPDKGAAVPKFGEWDESDPTSADGYTHIFNRVREERQSGAQNGTGIAPGMTSPYNSSVQRQTDNGSSKICCCFPWGRK